MNVKQQIVVFGGIVIFALLFFFGKTTSSKVNNQSVQQQKSSEQSLNTADLINAAKQKLTTTQQNIVTSIEKNIEKQNSPEQKIQLYQQLAKFWKDSAKAFEPYAFCIAEAAKLDNSEKSLTFAAQLFVDNLLTEPSPAMQTWLANNGKVLLEKALAINPNNDSTKVGIGACYILGNISSTPMQGLQMVKEVTEKNPNNIYAQWVLALGGKRSGQYAKAIERFLIILKNTPKSLPAMLHLAECYDMSGDKTNAIKWYKMVQNVFPNEEARKELQTRIDELSKP